MNEVAAGFFQAQLARSWVPGYLEARGIGPTAQRPWQPGYAPAAADALTCRLRRLGFRDELIEASGLARRSQHGNLTDLFRDRAMLPIRSADGTVTGFIGRASQHARPGTPKYVNSPRTSLYDKSKTLFGAWEGRQPLAAGAQPVIVEGPFDAIAVTTAGAGRFAGLAPCGTALTSGQLMTLSRVADLRETGVLAGFDPDRAGLRAAVRAYHLLTPFTEKTAAVSLPPGQDPAQVLAGRGPAGLVATLSRAHPLADLVVDAEVAKWARWLAHAEGRINALHAAAQLVAAMPASHVGRQVARLANRLDLDHATVTEALTDAIPRVVAQTVTAPWRRETTTNPASRTAGDDRQELPEVKPGRSSGTRAGRTAITGAARTGLVRPRTQDRGWHGPGTGDLRGSVSARGG